MYKLLPFAVAALIACQSCGGKSDASDADIRIEFETRTDSVGYIVFNTGLADTVYAAAKYSVVWPEKIGEEDFHAMRNQLMRITFGQTDKSIDKAAEDFLISPLRELSEDSDSIVYRKVPFTEAYDSFGNTYSQVNSEVTLLNPQLLVIRATSYVYYYGAAHGGEVVDYLNYSLVDHAILTPDNFFVPDSKTAILDLINEAVKAEYPPEALFDGPIEDFSTFEITDSDIVFVYQQYEVAPYSTGTVRVPVSQYDIYRFLTPLARQALSL